MPVETHRKPRRMAGFLLMGDVVRDFPAIYRLTKFP